jgi:hypothetical protein
LKIINVASLLNASANVNTVSRYAKLDFEPWYSFFNVNVEAVNRITASVRLAKEVAG